MIKQTFNKRDCVSLYGDVKRDHVRFVGFIVTW
jgi:hypothetical protein